jgi:hypothetical protein
MRRPRAKGKMGKVSMRQALGTSVGLLVVRTLWVSVVIAAGATAARGNPIFVTHAYELSGENVTINVYRSESRITGDYTFRAIQRQSERIDYTVGVRFPVILPRNGLTFRRWFSAVLDQKEQLEEQSIKQRLDLAKPAGTIDGHDFTPQPDAFEDSWRFEDVWRPAQIDKAQLPEGWTLVFFSGGECGNAKENRIKAHISYTQPHLPGNISAYPPILPNHIVKDNCLVTFHAAEGTRFAPVGKYDVVGQPSVTNLSVRPENLQLLKVRLVGDPTSAANLSPELREIEGLAQAAMGGVRTIEGKR